MKLVHYFDYKSPYSYLAQEPAFALAADGVEFAHEPLTLHIPSFLGAAELDEQGRDTVGERNEHQWRRVRYSYMDARREARRRGLTLRGPRKIFDSSVAHVGFLWARRCGDFRPYHECVFERFWRRELELGDPAAIEQVLLEVGAAAAGFRDYLAGEGRAELGRIQADAEAHGVFGVPSWRVIDATRGVDELFWGAERLPRVREMLEKAPAGAGEGA